MQPSADGAYLRWIGVATDRTKKPSSSRHRRPSCHQHVRDHEGTIFLPFDPAGELMWRFWSESCQAAGAPASRAGRAAVLHGYYVAARGGGIQN